jgi:hypothetical protein
MLGGIIAGALKGASDSYGEYSKSQLDQRQKIDLQQRLLDMAEEKERRISEFKEDQRVSGIGRTAEAEAKAAPIKVKGEVAAELAKLDESGKAGLPEAQGKYVMRQLDAKAPAIEKEALIKSKAEASGQVAKTSVAGYVDSIAKEDYAKSAGERSVAGISQQTQREASSKPNITQAADGTYYVGVWDSKSKTMSTSVLTDPKGEPLKGTRDLDARTKAMVDAKLIDARAELDPDSRKAIIAEVTELLGGSKGGAGGALPAPKTREDLNKLPAGTRYTAPDGTTRVKN